MPESPSAAAALYVHIPFCRARCAYCDFNTYAGLESLTPRYVAAVCREIEAAGGEWGRLTVPTIYFGGGTPSLLPVAELERLLHVSRLTFHVADDAEITLEANPGTVDAARLARIRALGVNRLSLGAQSAHDDELRLLGRIHTWEEAAQAFAAARRAGFENIGLDLIFGLPGQTIERWRATLDAAVGLGPEHLSLYALTVEEGTPLAARIGRGEIPPPDDDLAADMYVLAEKKLAGAGFVHYEISNWAKQDAGCKMQDARCRHNLIYWRNEAWLGVGAGAHSWLGERRWANARHPEAYIAALERGGSPADEVETIDRRLEMGETMMMGMRLAEGVSDERFHARFGVGLADVFGAELDELQELGLVEWDGCTAWLTARGRLLGNQVFARFV